MPKLKVALPSTTNKLDIALTNVSTVEIVKANPRIMIINEGGKVFSDVVPFDQKQIKKILYHRIKDEHEVVEKELNKMDDNSTEKKINF